MSSTSGGFFLLNGLSVFGVLLWLATLGMGLYAFILFVKLARRGITALDLYIYDKTIGNNRSRNSDGL
ncbi:hypothetical protein [Paenibacillus agri]|uniref:Uncharacterized protein n=1 Tax=Paenibacillus agri TaxID=2744309 RepID=A0A850EIA8_9BACL|nr:hypothetical protein [Paenibacillus agri]NUU60628.1 hypothetical protein [Paenibacillus agri]